MQRCFWLFENNEAFFWASFEQIYRINNPAFAKSHIVFRINRTIALCNAEFSVAVLRFHLLKINFIIIRSEYLANFIV